MTILDIADASRRFPGGTAALDGVSLRVEAGEFVALVGPSGCGKSTLLRLVSGLDSPTSGEVRAGTSRIAHVFQDPTLLPWRSLRRNVELLAELERVPRAERRRRAEEAIALVGLEGFERSRPAELSGGMRMRASLARSLVLDPELFLLDEPFGALDELTRERLDEELARLFTERRFAALLVTHSIAEAAFLAGRVVVMSPRPGRIVGEVAVPFPYPRAAELRFEAGFAQVCGEISDLTRSVTSA